MVEKYQLFMKKWYIVHDMTYKNLLSASEQLVE